MVFIGCIRYNLYSTAQDSVSGQKEAWWVKWRCFNKKLKDDFKQLARQN